MEKVDMHVEAIKAIRGVQVQIGGELHTAGFSFEMGGVGEDIDAAEKLAAELAENAINDWLDTVDPDGKLTETAGGANTEKHTQKPKVAAIQGITHPTGSAEMVQLIFEAANSKHRSDRIMRATTEEMSFEPGPDGDGWICTAHNGRQFRVNVDKDAGLGKCDCEDFVNRGAKSKMPCKHIYALAMSSDRFWDDQDKQVR